MIGNLFAPFLCIGAGAVTLLYWWQYGPSGEASFTSWMRVVTGLAALMIGLAMLAAELIPL